MKRKAVFFDIDGTLFATKIGIPKSAENAIKKLRANGHLAFINSGRSRGNIDYRFDEIGFDGYIAGGGSYVEIENKIIKNILFSKEELKHLTKVFKKAVSNVIYEGPKRLYYPIEDKDAMQKLFNMYPDVWPIERFEIYNNENAVVNKLCCQLYPNSDVELIKNELSDDYSLIIHARNEYAEAMPKGANKAIGIQEVLDYYQMDKEDTVAIGDSMNDMDMLEFTKTGVAMGNSCDELKEIADFCTKSIAHDGIEFALESLNLI